MKELLKSGLFGYTKLSVCEYIAAAAEDFSGRLLASDKAHSAEMSEMKERIKVLEEENKRLREGHENVTAVMLRAKAAADSIVKTANPDGAAVLRQADSALRQEEIARLAALSRNFNTLRDSLRDVADRVDSFLAETAAEINAMIEQTESAPGDAGAPGEEEPSA